MPLTRTESIKNFLTAKTHADLAAMYSHDMECQVNVAQDGGSRTEKEYKGKKYQAYSDGVQEWKAFRIPRNAATVPEYEDTFIRWSLEQHAEAIGMTGWDWHKGLSRWVAFDFDAMVGHSERHQKKLTEDELEIIKQALMKIPWVTLRHSTGGAGLHVYVFLTPVLTQNHNEHAALARAILGQLSGLTGCQFESQVDICGGNMWVWHRKMKGTRGLEVIKTGTVLTEIPPHWKDHTKVITGHRKKNLSRFLTDTDSGNDIERWFLDLTSQYPRTQLDEEHKRLMNWLTDHQTQSWWDADHHMLVTHTYHLKQAHADLQLRGIFDTLAEGTESGYDHNCYAFPMARGGWSVRRYSIGVSEKPNWDQDSRGWTRCFYNRDPDLHSASRTHAGTEDPAGGYVFEEAELAAEAARVLGASVPNLPLGLRTQRAKLKVHKDGRLVVEIEGDKNGIAAGDMQGWLHDKGKWKRLFPVQVGQPVEPESVNSDDSIRHLVAMSGQDAGWVVKRNDNTWDEEPLIHVTKILEGMGMGSKDIKSTVGSAALRAWRLVNRPFQPEYPGDRIWNRNAAQFKVVPSQKDVLSYPTWMRILQHVGTGLDDAIQNNPWAKANGVLSGADYLKLWIASLFKEPTEPLPYLFLYGNQNTGKSILHEALSLLMTKGYKLAHIALTSSGNFNEELGNAILCVVEELDLRKDKNAANRIKEWVTARQIAIHGKGYTPYQDINTTHWMQFANSVNFCPIFPGDTRITMIYVSDLAPEDRIPKKQMIQLLEREAPDFLAEILGTDIPPSNDRLNVPVITTAEKADAERMNQTPIETFLSEVCHAVSGKFVKYGELYDRFTQWADPGDAAYFTKQKFGRELPPQYPKGRLPTDGAFYIGNISFEPYMAGDPVLPKLKSYKDEKGQVFIVPEGHQNGKNT